MDIMSNIQALSSNTSFRELLRKFRQEQSPTSFMSWLIPTDEPSTFWWESSTHQDDENSFSELEQLIPSSPMGNECETCINEELDDASSSRYWLAYTDQDSASFSSAFSQEEGESSSDSETISSASSTYSDDDYYEEYQEKNNLPTPLGWWKIYRSGWWENSEGASTHFDETYVEYRFSALLPSIPECENEATSP